MKPLLYTQNEYLPIQSLPEHMLTSVETQLQDAPIASSESSPSLRREWPWLCLLLLLALAAGLLAHKYIAFYPLSADGEYGTPALEFLKTHRISSDFLSIGYSGFVGICLVLFHNPAGLVVANLTIYLSFVLTAWILFRELGASPKQAFWLGLLFAFYPDIILSVNKIYHAILTPLLLLAYPAIAIPFVRKRDSRTADLMLAVLLGVEVACRSNLILLFPCTWFLLWKFRLPHPLRRAAIQCVIAYAVFWSACVAIHGSPFWPRVGAYCLFSGWNEDTGQALLTSIDDTAEGTLIPALKLRGIDAYHDWGRPDNLQGDPEVRNPQFTKLYTRESLKFIYKHPDKIVTYTGIKIFTLFRPDLLIYRSTSWGGIVKILEAFATPLWILLCWLIPQRKGDPSRWIVGLTLAAYAVPLIASVTAPRNRVGMDVLCLLDSAAMLLWWFKQPKQLA